MSEYLHNITQYDHLLTQFVFPFAWRAIGAFAVWFFGVFVVKACQNLLVRALDRKRVDPTLVHYAKSSLGLLLKGLLVLSILSIFGIETTSFSAILAAAGVAIGVAWSGLLANFAAGIFLVILRPFKVGDTITAAGITGTVREIGLFATTIDNSDNLRVFAPNNKLFSDNILNYSANDYRAVLLKVQLARNVDPTSAISLLAKELTQVKNLIEKPVPTGEITEANTLGLIITMKVFCHNAVYTQVLADAHQVIYQALKTAKFPSPENRTVWVQEHSQS